MSRQGKMVVTQCIGRGGGGVGGVRGDFTGEVTLELGPGGERTWAGREGRKGILGQRNSVIKARVRGSNGRSQEWQEAGTSQGGGSVHGKG